MIQEVKSSPDIKITLEIYAGADGLSCIAIDRVYGDKMDYLDFYKKIQKYVTDEL